MNINHRTYETFAKRLKRLIDESGDTISEFALKIDKGQPTLSKYLSGALTPNPNTLIKMADCLNVTIDYLLCRKSSVLSLQSHQDNIYIFDRTAFGFSQLTREYDNFLASLLGNDALVKHSSDTISLISLLVSIFLRDTVSVYKKKDGLTDQHFRAYLFRSDEAHKIVNYLMSRLAHDLIFNIQPDARISAVKLNIKESVWSLIDLFIKRDDGISDIFLETMLLSLKDSVRCLS